MLRGLRMALSVLSMVLLISFLTLRLAPPPVIADQSGQFIPEAALDLYMKIYAMAGGGEGFVPTTWQRSEGPMSDGLAALRARTDGTAWQGEGLEGLVRKVETDLRGMDLGGTGSSSSSSFGLPVAERKVLRVGE